MEIKEQKKLRFKGVDFPSVQLLSMKPFQESDDNKIKVTIRPQVFLPDDLPNFFKIILLVELSVEDHFSMTIKGIGTFEVYGDGEDEITDEEKNNFINNNAVAITFPYVRAFISTITSNLGKVITPVTLQTRFFRTGEIERIESMQG